MSKTTYNCSMNFGLKIPFRKKSVIDIIRNNLHSYRKIWPKIWLIRMCSFRKVILGRIEISRPFIWNINLQNNINQQNATFYNLFFHHMKRCRQHLQPLSSRPHPNPFISTTDILISTNNPKNLLNISQITHFGRHQFFLIIMFPMFPTTFLTLSSNYNSKQFIL